MKKFSMTCSCGDVMEVEADDLEAAKAKLKAQMDQAAIDAHMSEKHAGQSPMTMEQVHAAIDAQLVEVMA